MIPEEQRSFYSQQPYQKVDENTVRNLIIFVNMLDRRVKALEEKYIRYHAIGVEESVVPASEKKEYLICSRCGVRIEK